MSWQLRLRKSIRYTCFMSSYSLSSVASSRSHSIDSSTDFLSFKSLISYMS